MTVVALPTSWNKAQLGSRVNVLCQLKGLNVHAELGLKAVARTQSNSYYF